MPRWLILIAYLLLPVMMLSCAGSGENDTRQNPPDPSVLPSDLTIIFGQRSPQPARWQGHTIEPDGRVVIWRGEIEEEHPYEMGYLPESNRLALWKGICEHGFFDLEIGKHGNITRFIRVTAGGKTHQAYWVPQVETTEVRSHLRALYQSCSQSIVVLGRPPMTW